MKSRVSIWLAVISASAVFFVASGALAANGTPANDSTFYVKLVSDGPGVPMVRLPEELGQSQGSMGVLVVRGAIVEATDPAQLENSYLKQCNTVAGWTCSGTFNVSGTYQDGRLRILSASDVTYTYDGTPMDQGSIYEGGKVVKAFAPVPVVPGTVNMKSETRYECERGSGETLSCEMTRTYVDLQPKATCVESIKPPFPGAYGWDLCAKVQYAAKPQQQKTGKATALLVPLNGAGIIATVSGDVEVIRAGGATVPARIGTVVKPGDSIATGFEEAVSLDFDYATLNVHQLTQLKIDELVNKDNIARTQLSLNIGKIQAIVKHQDAIRSDFSVTTPTANASIRGSAMQVSYDDQTKQTIAIAIEDTAYVKGSSDAAAIEVPESKQVTVDATGKAGAITQATITPDMKTTKATPDDSAKKSASPWLYGALAIPVIAALVWLVKKKKIT